MLRTPHRTLPRRTLITLGLLGLALHALPAAAGEGAGTRVTIRPAEDGGALPEPVQLVQTVEAEGGEHQVRVLRHHTDGREELTLDIWGATVPASDIPATLRAAFPVLASADIQVTSLPPGSRPSLEGVDPHGVLQGGTEAGGQGVRKVKIIRKHHD